MTSTSGTKPANLLATGTAAGHLSTLISRGGTWLGFEGAITSTENERTTIMIVTGSIAEKVNQIVYSY